MDSFAETIGRLVMIHARVKALDRNALSETRRTQRARQMTQLRQATDTLVKVEFTSLSKEAKKNAEELDDKSKTLQKDLEAQKTAIKVLDTIGSALGAITSLVKLFA